MCWSLGGKERDSDERPEDANRRDPSLHVTAFAGEYRAGGESLAVTTTRRRPPGADFQRFSEQVDQLTSRWDFRSRWWPTRAVKSSGQQAQGRRRVISVVADRILECYEHLQLPTSTRDEAEKTRGGVPSEAVEMRMSLTEAVQEEPRGFEP